VSREVLVVTHTGRPETTAHARLLAGRLQRAGFVVRILESEAEETAVREATVVSGTKAAEGVEIVLALGGDGTLLRAAALARPVGAPLLGVNLGRVGFLAEVEADDDLDETVRRIEARDYLVEERLTLDVVATRPGEPDERVWALNEVTVEKAARERMIEVLASVEGRPLARWGCDGVVCATPTGSTAYAFSAGGPVIWPEVEALLMVPISAHALFARPLVMGPESEITLEVAPGGASAFLAADGQRVAQLPAGSRVKVRRGQLPVRVVRLHPQPFSDRLVAKFALPVDGWRGESG
jgi:NAD+ kinase